VALNEQKSQIPRVAQLLAYHRPFVDYWFDNARRVNRRTPLVDTFRTILAGHNSPIMLRDLLEFLTTSGGDAALIEIVRARLIAVTASN
jgi:hypothetical protein